MNNIFIGARVRYIRKDTAEDRATGYYPPIGTLGTVREIYADTYVVKWDYGTKGNGVWSCEHADVEIVTFQSDYSYLEFKKELERTCGLSEREMYYIIGVFFDKTDGYTKPYSKAFYNIHGHTNLLVSWSPNSYGWNVEFVKV